MTQSTQKRQHEKLIEQLAAQHLGIATLETRHSDSLDFHEVAVWRVRTALEAAFRAGKAAASLTGGEV